MILSSIKKLKIRAKLLLLLFLPACIVIYLGISKISVEQLMIEESKELIYFLKLSQSLNSIIYNIQLERDYTGESFFGHEDASARLTKLYSNTDKNITQFLQLIKTASHSLHQQHINLDEFASGFGQINLLRKRINSHYRGNFNYYFDEYNDYIQKIIAFMTHFQEISTDSQLLHKINSYINLVQAQEYAGQERTLLNTIFLRGEMDIDTYKLIISIISQQNSFLNLFYQGNSGHFTDELKSLLDTSLTREMLVLRQAGLDKAKKNFLLNQIQNIIGYGGLIHDFKNYVIRDNLQ